LIQLFISHFPHIYHSHGEGHNQAAEADSVLN